MARRLSRCRSTAAVLVVLAVLAAACADDPSIESTSLVDGLAAAVIPDAPELVTDIDCPDPEAGVIAQTLTCTAALHGEPITIDLEIDAEGLVDATVREPLLDLGEIETVAGQRLELDLGTTVTVRCAGTVVVLTPGSEVACTGTSNGVMRDLVVEVLPDATWSVAFAG